MEDPRIAKRLAKIGADIPPPTSAVQKRSASSSTAEIDKWVPLIKAAGVSRIAL